MEIGLWLWRWTRDQQVPGFILTHSAVDYGPGQAAYARALLSPNSGTIVDWQWCFETRNLTVVRSRDFSAGFVVFGLNSEFVYELTN